jgi:hypothetical protein
MDNQLPEVTVKGKIPTEKNDSINYVKNGSGANTNTEEFKKKYASEIQRHVDSGKSPEEALQAVYTAKKAQYQGPSKVPGTKKSFYDVFKKP